MEILYNDIRPGQVTSNALKDPDLRLFVENDDSTDVLLLRSTVAKLPFKKNVLNSTAEIKQHVANDTSAGIRIISISSDDSYSPLRITQPAFRDVLEALDVAPDFLGIIKSMGVAPHEAEIGNGHVIENRSEDGSFNMSYLFRYFALKEWKDEDVVRRSWKLRQIGVYHSFSATQDCHTFIFLHPEDKSAFQRSLLRLVCSARQSSLIHYRPMIPHAMLLSCYMNDWTRLIQQRGDQFLKDKENLLAQRLKDLRVEARFKHLQFWYDLEDRLVPMEPVLLSMQSQLDTLQRFDHFLTTAHESTPNQAPNACYTVLSMNWFSSRKRILDNFLVSVRGLHKRTKEIVHLIEITLELNNQRKLEAINNNLLDLSKKNHAGAENVKVITVLTLFFLPASLVSSFFGMNFFDFNEQSRIMTTASNTWLYAAITIPLIVVTMFLWQSIVWLLTRSSGPDDDEEDNGPAEED